MPWYKIELTEAQLVDKKNLDIHDKFDKVWIANGCPESFCLFSDKDGGEFATTYYLSPDSADSMMRVIKEYKGEECSRPRKDEVAVQIGHANDENMLL